jgi:hypothetical protein
MAKRKQATKADMRRFIEWVTERAKEEEGQAQGSTRTLLQAIGDDGDLLLNGRPAPSDGAPRDEGAKP